MFYLFRDKYTTSTGQFCSRSLGCSPNSMTALLVQLFVGFMVSGLMHSAGDAMVGIQHLWASLPFFLAQPVAITLETAVIDIARQAGYTRSNIWIRLVGYAWVFYGSASQCPGSSTGQCPLGSAIVRSCPFHQLGVRYALCNNLQGSGFCPIRNRNNLIIITNRLQANKGQTISECIVPGLIQTCACFSVTENRSTMKEELIIKDQRVE